MKQIIIETINAAIESVTSEPGQEAVRNYAQALLSKPLRLDADLVDELLAEYAKRLNAGQDPAFGRRQMLLSENAAEAEQSWRKVPGLLVEKHQLPRESAEHLTELARADYSALTHGSVEKVEEAVGPARIATIHEAHKHWAAIARQAATEFHMPYDACVEILKAARKQFGEFRRPEYRVAIGPVFMQLKARSREYFLDRRAKSSPLAAALKNAAPNGLPRKAVHKLTNPAIEGVPAVLEAPTEAESTKAE